MIYTSYFAYIKKLPESIVPIAISATVPASVEMLRYTELAPSFDILMDWKHDNNNERYVKEYNEKILNPLDARQVISDLYKLSRGKDIALICYEKPEDFCHRHLAAKWLTESGLCGEVLEYKEPDKQISLFDLIN